MHLHILATDDLSPASSNAADFTEYARSVGAACTWEELMMRAPAVRKAEMMGRDNRLHRKPSRSTASSRYNTATIRDTYSTIQGSFKTIMPA